MKTLSRIRTFVAVLGLGVLLALRVWAAPGPADGPRSETYREGQRALSEERWSDALGQFSKLAAAKGDEADAALYWQAWTEWKLGQRADALTSIRKLTADYPKSEWVDDARVLELEISGRKGDSVAKLEKSDDEELKLYALEGLMQVEPERAVPILESFLAANHSFKLKERALFVLAMSETPRAREILIEIVRSGQPPELRLKAVEQLGVAGGPEDLQALSKIWSESTPEVKVKVLEAWMIADQVEPIFKVAREEKDPKLRRKAIEQLGVLDATQQLGELYASETDPDVRAHLLEAYGVAGDIGALSRAARGEKDTRLRAKAIEGLGVFGEQEGSRELVALYAVEPERDLREKILEALMVNGDAQALIELFRKETDKDLKRAILQQISLLDDDAVEGLLREVLEVEK